jgi:hypothetical protein
VGTVTDLFSPPAPTRVGQANGEFLAHLAMMAPAERAKITPSTFPHASPACVMANVRFHAGTQGATR